MSRSYSLTLPYNSLTPVPAQHRRQSERIRCELESASLTARRALDEADRWDREWSDDLDPSPKRVFRTSDAYGEQRTLAVETKDAPGKYQRPSKLVEEKVGHHKSTVLFEKGEVQRLEQLLVGSDGGTEKMLIEVDRKNQTVRYTVHETGGFALEPLGYPSSSIRSRTDSLSEGGPVGSGPDEVYDEFDNSRRGGGPDDVSNEWDNGRGYYYDGPDGRSSYDPYH